MNPRHESFLLPEKLSSEVDHVHQSLVASQPSPESGVEQVADGSDNAVAGSDHCGVPDLSNGEVCVEIRRRHHALQEVGRRSLEEAIALGSLLTVVKGRLSHGQWYPFLAEAEVGTRAAQNYLRLYRHREQLLSKSALSADLTIAASLGALRSPKPKVNQTKQKCKKRRETSLTVQATPSVPVQEDTGSDDPASSTTPSEELEHHDRQGNHGEVADLTLEGDLANRQSIEDRIETPTGDNAVETSAPTMAPAEGADSALLSEISEVPVVEEATGFLSVEGAQLPADRWDSGLIPFKWVQMQITSLASNNKEAPAGRKRNLPALTAEQTCLVELARTANRVLSSLEAGDEDVASVITRALANLRNYTNSMTIDS